MSVGMCRAMPDDAGSMRCDAMRCDAMRCNRKVERGVVMKLHYHRPRLPSWMCWSGCEGAGLISICLLVPDLEQPENPATELSRLERPRLTLRISPPSLTTPSQASDQLSAERLRLQPDWPVHLTFCTLFTHCSAQNDRIFEACWKISRSPSRSRGSCPRTCFPTACSRGRCERSSRRLGCYLSRWVSRRGPGNLHR